MLVAKIVVGCISVIVWITLFLVALITGSLFLIIAATILLSPSVDLTTTELLTPFYLLGVAAVCMYVHGAMEKRIDKILAEED